VGTLFVGLTLFSLIDSLVLGGVLCMPMQSRSVFTLFHGDNKVTWLPSIKFIRCCLDIDRTGFKCTLQMFLCSHWQFRGNSKGLFHPARVGGEGSENVGFEAFEFLLGLLRRSFISAIDKMRTQTLSSAPWCSTNLPKYVLVGNYDRIFLRPIYHNYWLLVTSSFERTDTHY